MTTCPDCGASLNATATISLYDVELDGPDIVRFEGGPTPESEQT